MDTLFQLCSNLSVYLARDCLPLALTRLKKKKSYKKTKSTTLVQIILKIMYCVVTKSSSECRECPLGSSTMHGGLMLLVLSFGNRSE